MSSPSRVAAAFDLGTTTIAGSLLDLERGDRLALSSALNPQRPWGGDVLTRLDAASSVTALKEMQSCTNRELERMTDELLAQAGVAFDRLDGVAVAGNPAMEHILLGLPVKALAHPPFRPRFTKGQVITTRQLGWSRDCPAYLLPLPGGFVGGDTVAFLFGQADRCRPPSLCLDLGTNAEIALFDGESFHATSAAAGPAFEGGNLSCGMAALPGAVTGVRIEGERVLLSTVASAPPKGICGSGVLEAVAALLAHGVLERTGRLLDPSEIPSNLANRVTTINGIPAFVLHRDATNCVYLNQEDIRALQLAKGALTAGMEFLLQRAGIAWDDLEQVVLTGSFGAVLSPAILKSVGIFNEKMVSIAGFVREGALSGVERLLLERDGLAHIESLATRVRVVPLSGTPLFERLFLAHLNFP